jgi:E3 ubiquitin-protein ligase ZNF598
MTDALPGAPTSPRSRQNSRGGRRRGGPASSRQDYPDGFQRGHNFRGSRGDRGTSGRGRVRSSHSSYVHDAQLNIGNAQSRDHGPEGGNKGENLNVGQIANECRVGQQAVGDQKKPVEEGELCFICASNIEHLSIAPCNHQTCHICALRLRALYKKRDCAYCKVRSIALAVAAFIDWEVQTEAPYVIFTDNAAKRYEEFAKTDFVRSDENLGIKYEREIILEDTVLLLRYNCPDQDCDVACLGWPHLHRHVKQKHGKLMCDLCTRNKKVFTHEHELYTYGELRRHEKLGDDHPGAIDQSGFKGHPECGFCRERFYGDDELYQHCREKHERCHICDRRNPGSQVQYYLNYQMLEKHFEEMHFVCLDAECQANKTNVFESEMDLKAHQLSSHPNGLSKDARRDARLVNISSFDYRTPYQPQRRGDRDHRGNGRGRDPNAEALPVSSAQPLRRDELAYQRQMAILTSQPQLVPRNHAASPVPTAVPRPTQPSASLPNLDTFSLDPSSNPHADQNLAPQEHARQIRHSSVLQRASTLLKADGPKLSTFRNHVSSCRSSAISATELIDSFFSLFDVPSVELGKLVRELADIYEDEAKRQDLLKAWNDWLSINADYPSLPGPSGVLPGTDSGSGDARPSGRRVLRLKSSTAKSSRSAVSRQGSWGNALGDSDSSKSNPFPALGGASSLSNGQKKAAWTGVRAFASAGASPADSRPSPRPPPTTGAKRNEEMFPALPMGKKPNTLMAGLTRGAVRWDDGRSGNMPVSNPWGGGANGPTSGASNQAVADGIADAGGDSANHVASGGVGKKGKKGKQVLYKFG